MSEKVFVLTQEAHWRQMALWDRLKIFRIPQVILFVLGGLLCQLILTSVSFQDMVIPEVVISNGSSTTLAMNPTYGYPLKLGGNLCFPEELSQCLSDPTREKECCEQLYDEDSWPEETVTVLEEFLIIFFCVLAVAVIRLQLWRVSTQRSGFEYCQKYWALILWDTLFGAFLAFEYSFFLTNFIKVSVSAPRPFYYAAKIYCSIHSDHRKSFKENATKSFPSGHTSTSMSTFGYLTFLSLEDIYHLSKTFSWSSNSTILMLQFALIPIFIFAVWISATRIHDYFHFAADVLAGVIIGLLCALFSLHHLSPYSRSLRSVTQESFRLERDRTYSASQGSEENLLSPSNSKAFYHRSERLLV